MEMKIQVDNTKTKKHTNKINDLLGVSSPTETQTWETRVQWPNVSVLEDFSEWDTDGEEEAGQQDEEEEADKQDEEEDEQEDEEQNDENENDEEEDF